MDNSERTTIYKQSEMLKDYQKKCRELKRENDELRNDLYYFKMALASALKDRGGRMVFRENKNEPEFSLEYNVSGEPIIILI